VVYKRQKLKKRMVNVNMFSPFG